MSSGPEPTSPAQPPKDFFVSYTGGDRTWAEWIAFTLEEAGYTTVIQAWDSRPGMNFVAMMNDATKQTEQTIAVLSGAYLESECGFAEWAVAFRRDPTGSQRRLVPIRIEACEVQGLLGPIVYVDLVGLDEAQAKERLLAGVKPGRAKPLHAGFPGSASSPKSGALVLERPLFPPSLPPRWNIPYPRNPYFLGREEVLDQLTAALRTGQPTVLSQPAKDVHLQAISGLGGIGKTHIALEYAYRYRSDYQAVLWVKADTRENLTSSFLAMAALLDLPEKEASESDRVVVAVQRWLQVTSGYLLILDNADNLALAREFLPPLSRGHIILTTRAHTMDRLAQRIEVNTLDPKMGALLLARRMGLVGPQGSLDATHLADLTLLRAITEELGGLPLAIDQAGAYIEETECGLGGYQHLYRIRRAELLRSRGRGSEDHPDSVATTWSLSFEQVEKHHPAAADLLRLCAFLAPDAIPEEVLTEDTGELGEVLASLAVDDYQLNQAVKALLAYSLIARNPKSRTLTVHRLVQAVLRDSMSTKTQQQWMSRAIQAIGAAYPSLDFADWPTFERLLPHALLCATWIEHVSPVTSKASYLLSTTGSYLYDRGHYTEAEPLLRRALAIDEQELGTNHPDVASSLNNLARLYREQGKYAGAQLLYQRALAICERELGASHPDTASILNNLAATYSDQGKYAEAEPLYQRALAICERELGTNHSHTAASQNNLAELYRNQGRYEEAEPLYQRALAICERELGANHPSTAQILNNLANLYYDQEKHAEGELFCQRTLTIRERELGANHPDTAESLNNLANLYREQGKYAEAEPLYQCALTIRERELGASHPDTATSLHNLALLYHNQGKYAEAEPLYQCALAIYERELGANHPLTAGNLNSLAGLYWNQGKYAKAELFYQRALAICERELGANHPDTARTLDNLAGLYCKQGRYTEAVPLLQRTLVIWKRTLGSEHPITHLMQANYTALLEAMQ